MAKRLLSLLLVLTMLFSVSVPAFAEAAGTEPAPEEQSGEPALAEPVDGQETPAPDLPQAEPEAAEDPGADSAPAPDEPALPEETPETAPAPDGTPEAAPAESTGPVEPEDAEAPAEPPAAAESPDTAEPPAPEETEQSALPAPELDKLESTAEGLKLSWKPVEGANTYRVFLKDGEDWKELEDTEDTEYLWADAQAGESVTLTVGAIDAQGTVSAFDEEGLTAVFAPPEEIAAIAAEAPLSGDCGPGLTWTFDEAEGTLRISGTGPMYNYSSSSENPWYGWWNLKKIILDDGVTTIGDYAFYLCNFVEEISIPQTVTYIGDYAFENCDFAAIDLPTGLTSLGKWAFASCDKLKEITIPAGVNSLLSGDGGTFSGCTALTDIHMDPGNKSYQSVNGVLFDKAGKELLLCPQGKTGAYAIPDGVMRISDRAFSGCAGLTSVSFPSGITEIEYRAFSGCAGLTGLVLPAGLEKIGYSAFSGCAGLRSVSLPEGITEIGYSAFSGCRNLGEIVLPDSLKNISGSMFSDCTALAAVTFGSQVSTIADSAFSYCVSLKSVTIPASVTRINSDAFSGCSSLTSLTVLNPDCLIGVYSYDQSVSEAGRNTLGTPGVTVLSGCSESTAEAYAKEFGYTFNSLGGRVLLPAPQLLSLEDEGYGWVSVRFAPVPGAVNYQLLYKTGSGDWQAAKDAYWNYGENESVCIFEFPLPGYVSGCEASFSVRCVNEAGTQIASEFDQAGMSITLYDYKAPVLTAVTQVGGGIQIDWKSTGSGRYFVYKKENGADTWAKLADVRNVNSYIWKGAKAGTSYSFTVRCVSYDGKTFTSDYDPVGLSITYTPTEPTLAAPVLTETVNTATGVKLSWTAVAEAKTYRVYYSTDGGTTWKKAADTKALTYTWTGAKAGWQYLFAVQSIDGKLTSAYSPSSAYIIRVAQPGVPKITGGEGGLTLTWSKAAGAARYNVLMKTASQGWDSATVRETEFDALTYTWADALTAGETYQFSIQAVAGDGSLSTWNEKGTAWTVVGKSGAPEARNGATGVELSWTGASEALKYQVYYRVTGTEKWLKAGTTAGTSYIWKGAKANIPYEFAVQGLNGKFSGEFSDFSASITRLTQPALPKVTGGEDGLSLTWTAVKGLQGSYTVLVKEGGGDWVPKYTSNTNSCTVPQDDLYENTDYLFSIQTVAADGSESTWNGKGTAWTVVGVPDTPNVKNGATGVELTWDGVTTAQKYQVYYRSQSISGGKWLKAGTTASTSYIWKGAKANTTYEFAVQGLKGKFSGAYSKQSASITRLTQPALPKVTGGEDGLLLTWTAIKGLQGSYTVLVKEGGGDWVPKYTSNTNSYTVPQDKLRENTDYLFSIQTKAADGSGVSTWNGKGTAWTVVGVPSIQEAKNGATGIELTWTGVTTAQKYQVYYRSQNISGGKWLKAGTTANTSYTWKGAKANTTYEFAVQGLKGKFSGTYSDASAQITRVTQPALPKVTGAGDELTLSWTAIKGMTGIYHVYVKEGEGDWTPKYKTDTNSFTVPKKELTAGTAYLFSIQAEMNGDKGTWNGKGTAWTAVGVPGTPTAVIGAKGIDLTWTGVETALKYQVYYRVTGTEKWLKAGATAGTAFTWKGAKADTAYEFAVQGLSGKYSSAYSAPSASITRVAQTALTEIVPVAAAGLPESAAEKTEPFARLSLAKPGEGAAAGYGLSLVAEPRIK